MYTHKKFFVAAGLSGFWYGAIELVEYLGWYWLVVVLLVVPCVLCFGLWLRLEDERETKRCNCIPEEREPYTTRCGTCVTFEKCRDELKLSHWEPSCQAYQAKLCGTCTDRDTCDMHLTDFNVCGIWRPEQ